MDNIHKIALDYLILLELDKQGELNEDFSLKNYSKVGTAYNAIDPNSREAKLLEHLLDKRAKPKHPVDIHFCPENEMLNIEYKKICLFYGNYWDFKRDPDSLKQFLESLDFKVNHIRLSEDDLIWD